ncbi:MAG: LacI family DNA-binding transcriptional regulator [Armatimonadota bacterium]|nr:LacI family DNA-binding transcriptional regulator [Armatimonadota bacterium]MDR5704290.1 LacI family DNA-binding transcriptional regulator [Armatimonadota bacterium]
MTIRDIARLTGYSVATVSRVLNGHPHVHPQTRARILSVIQKNGFQPHHAARALATSRTYVLGLLMSDITNPFYPELARGVEDAAAAHGYRVILCNTDGDLQKERAYITSLIRGRVDGLIFASVRLDDSFLQHLVQQRFPLVLANRRFYGLPVDSVAVDNVLGAKRAVSHLISHGHERIVHITGPSYVSNAVERLQGYREAMEEAGLKVRKEWIVAGDFTRRSGYAKAIELLSLKPRPTAIFAENDNMAVGALGAAFELGLRVPEDVAIVGFDDIDLAGAEAIQLTTVSQHTYEMGEKAVSLLLQRIEAGERRDPIQVTLDPTLIIRRSCGCQRTPAGISTRDHKGRVQRDV